MNTKALITTLAVLGSTSSLAMARHREESYRTRTFTYFALAALVWWKNSGRGILIGESGVGCLGPSLVPVGSEHPVRGSHPDFTEALEDVLSSPDLGADLSEADREIGTCAVLTLDELAGIADRVEQRNAEIAELAASLREPIETTRTRLGTLIRAFRSEWRAFLAQLPEASWIHSLTFHGAA